MQKVWRVFSSKRRRVLLSSSIDNYFFLKLHTYIFNFCAIKLYSFPLLHCAVISLGCRPLRPHFLPGGR